MSKINDFANYDNVGSLNDSEHLFLAGGVAGFVPVKENLLKSWDQLISTYEDTHGSKELIRRYRETELSYTFVSDNNILPISGGTAGLYVALSEVIRNKGKKILVFTPCWSLYSKIITNLGGECVFVDFQQEEINDFINKITHIIYNKFGAILISSPMNPSGIVVKKDIWIQLIKLAVQKNMQLIVDETYYGLDYDKKSSVLDVCVNNNFLTVIRSLSKYYCMPGLRVGFIIASSSLISTYHDIARNMYLSVSNFSQKVATKLIEELKDTEWHKTYCLPRLQRFKELSYKYPCLKIIHPDSAFFICFSIQDKNGNNISAQRLAEETGIVVRDCLDFKMEGFLRINLCCSKDLYDMFLKKMQLFLETLEGGFLV